MADDADKQTSSAEKAYAAAAAAAPPKGEPAKAAVAAKVAELAAPKEAAAPSPKAKALKPASTPPKKPKKKKVPLAAMAKPAPRTTQPTITQLKEKIMATAKTPEFPKTITDTVGEVQARAKAAFDKSSELAAEATEFAKGNVEALVESGKIFAAGVQDLGKTYAEEAKSAYETATADLKEMAAIKSPTELFQLQGKLLRRNFDTFIAYSSKNTEAMVKLANDSFAPISGRMSVAAEKFSKVA